MTLDWLKYWMLPIHCFRSVYSEIVTFAVTDNKAFNKNRVVASLALRVKALNPAEFFLKLRERPLNPAF